MAPDFAFEDEMGGLRGRIVCGVDEVGRGPLAGPVVAAAVVLPRPLPELLRARLDDSKRLSPAWRARLGPLILATARCAIGRAEVAEIDRVNILEASLLAMQRAVAQLTVDAALVDGNRPPALSCPMRCLVRGDQRSFSIAAASIIAKLARDAEMARLAAHYPGYGWEHNAGYGTALHLAALRRLGATPLHRRSFAPVAAIIAESGRDADDRRCRTGSHRA